MLFSFLKLKEIKICVINSVISCINNCCDNILYKIKVVNWRYIKLGIWYEKIVKL